MVMWLQREHPERLRLSVRQLPLSEGQRTCAQYSERSQDLLNESRLELWLRRRHLDRLGGQQERDSFYNRGLEPCLFD
jgi:hypothetical protein